LAHDHKKVVCKCGNVVSQCRCFIQDKRIEKVETCDVCNAKRLHVETPTEQRKRLMGQLGSDIMKEQTSNGNDPTTTTLKLLEWLVDARIEIENFKREKHLAKPKTRIAFIT
jgi:hypothetical protein